MYKTKEQMTAGELLYLKLGYYMVGKIIKGKTYYKINGD